MKRLTRRTFVRSTAALAATAWTAKSWSAVAGANEGVRMGVIGINGRGGNHIDAIKRVRGLKLVAICDVDRALWDRHDKEGNEIAAGLEKYQDLRKMYEQKDIDAVSIATPNHWHSLAAIWAVQAGKDVYVEKPVSHNVSEGRRLVQFARKYNKIVQAGTQSRSSREGIFRALEYVGAGKLGKIKLARALCYKPRPTIGKVSKPIDPPKSVDFDLWTGPAELLPIKRGQFHYQWHWFWNTGNGDLGNQGIHEVDVARWFLGVNELSPVIVSVGGRKGYVDDGETPNELISWHAYPQAPLVVEVRGLPTKRYAPGVKAPMDNYKGATVGIVIECEGGYVTIPNYDKAVIHDEKGAEVETFTDKGKGLASMDTLHFANFLKGVESRKPEDLYADIEQGHLSSALCHTSNISHRLGHAASGEEIKEALKADAAFAEAFDRMSAHLAANKVDISRDELTLGMPLKMDGKAETFVGNDEANTMLTRNYREPYVVPASV